MEHTAANGRNSSKPYGQSLHPDGTLTANTPAGSFEHTNLLHGPGAEWLGPRCMFVRRCNTVCCTPRSRHVAPHVAACCAVLRPCVVRQSMIAEEKEAAKLATAAAAEEDKNIFRMEEVMAHQH